MCPQAIQQTRVCGSGCAGMWVRMCGYVRPGVRVCASGCANLKKLKAVLFIFGALRSFLPSLWRT
eukprot:3503540-Pyramimonas_sp.AAC.2